MYPSIISPMRNSAPLEPVIHAPPRGGIGPPRGGGVSLGKDSVRPESQTEHVIYADMTTTLFGDVVDIAVSKVTLY